MKKFVLETIDFTRNFKGYRIPIPFFLLCMRNYKMFDSGNSYNH